MAGKGDTVQLVCDIRENKPGALERLLDEYGRAILGYIKSKNLLNDSDSEDIYQDTVIGVWKEAGAYTPEAGSLLGYLLGIAGRAVAAYYQSAANDGEGSENDGYEYGEEAAELPDETGLAGIEADEEIPDASGEEAAEEKTAGSPEADMTDGVEQKIHPVERFPELKGTPDYLVMNSTYLHEKYILLLKALMGEVAPAHQALQYAVLKLASGAAENLKGLEAGDLADKTLFELLLLFKREYAHYSEIPDKQMDDEIMLMFNRLDELENGRKLGSFKLEELDGVAGEKGLDRIGPAVKAKIRDYIDGKFLEIFKV